MDENTFDKLSSRKYTASEVAEMVNLRSPELFSVDFGYCSEWYRSDLYFETVFSQIRNKADIDMVIEVIVSLQEYQTNTTHNPKVCYQTMAYMPYVPYVNGLRGCLCDIRDRTMRSRELMERRRRMMAGWMAESADSVQTSTESVQQQPATEPEADGDGAEYRLADLPKDVRNQILIEDDKKYSEFVSVIKGAVKNWIDKHNLQDWNVVRLVCRRWGIFAKESSMEIFAKFLEHIGFGYYLSSMKQRKDANDKKALKSIELYSNDNLYRLKKDAKEIEECFPDYFKVA